MSATHFYDVKLTWEQDRKGILESSVLNSKYMFICLVSYLCFANCSKKRGYFDLILQEDPAQGHQIYCFRS